ncbi:MAG: DUF1350 family protein [Richelia sp. RM2_1_2]|nr:DUF1350 family protein [Richelia sp. SM1_7_0]NJN08056.1 DUF1350 family protein [Richelia sp. RM1_1_1]NJO29329.1 DUF1350 family protein [Richelia sp. SL_2_1]NJO61783.1 DUF1350 family protein [Richelia sp. RM2_1_2]
MTNDNSNNIKLTKDINKSFYFRKFSNSWVAINPNPKGIIQFIGSFVFGSFPINSYKYLLQNLFAQGYTIFVFRFPLTPFKFDHWQVAINLLKEEYRLRVETIRFLMQNDNISHHNLEIYLNDSNYYWLGHSLGCKYITLLEILSNESIQRNLIIQNALGDRYDQKLISLIKSVDIAREKAEHEISKLLNKPININNHFIQDQPSILLAPEISNTVTINKHNISKNKPFSNLELRVYPNARETKHMITQSQKLFNLTGIISFAQDCIAKDDVTFFAQQLSLKPFRPPVDQKLFGWHLEPNGIQIEHLGTYINQIFTKLIQQ